MQTIYSGEDPRWKLANPSGTELIFKYRKAHNLIEFFKPVFRVRKFLDLPNQQAKKKFGNKPWCLQFCDFLGRNNWILSIAPLFCQINCWCVTQKTRSIKENKKPWYWFVNVDFWSKDCPYFELWIRIRKFLPRSDSGSVSKLDPTKAYKSVKYVLCIFLNFTARTNSPFLLHKACCRRILHLKVSTVVIFTRLI